MTVTFGAPVALLLLLLVPGALWLARHRLRVFSPRQRRMALVLRGLLFSALVLALADPRLGRADDRLSIVVAVDTSASIQEPQRLVQDEWLRQVRGLARAEDQLSVLTFGRWGSQAPPEDVEHQAAPDATNLADALDLAENLLADSGRKRIVLLTDGQENIGRAQESASRLSARGVEISFLRPEPPLALADVLIRGLDAPAYLREGEALQVDVAIESTHHASATLRLLVDGRPLGERQVEVQPGSQRVPLITRPIGLGHHVLKIELEADDDAIRANNTAETFTVVKPSGQVLVLESRQGEAGELVEALRESGLRTELQAASSVPPSAAPLQDYDSIVLVNVPSTGLTLDQQATLHSFVHDYGRGLLVAGGNTGFSLGGYGGSLLGDLLPVDPTPPARRELGSVALFIVIDKSGSMDLFRNDVSKINMAKEAAMLATEALSVNDQVAVMVFDTRFQWIVPLTRLQGAADVAAVKARIAAVRADGGTNIFPAMEAAYQEAAAAQAKLKHIVLLTDGQSPDGNYAGLIAQMKPNNITLTTIGVGSDADTALLSRLALQGDGRYYFTERAQEVPRIMTRETTIVSRNALVEGLIRPQVAEPSPLLADLSGQEPPALNGYVATTPRARAHTILTSDRGDPLLAHWQYGLGRAVAWTSDARSEWAAEWFNSPPARRVWGQVVRWSMPPPTDTAFQLSSALEEDRVTLRVEALEPDGRFANGRDIQATVTTPTEQAYRLPLRQVGPGVYEVVLQAPGQGAYAVVAEELRNGRVIRSETGAFVVTPVVELRTVGPNRQLLEQLAQTTGGRELTQPREVFARNPSWQTARWTPLWPWLLAFAMVLLPLDIAARRLSIFRV